MNEMTQNIVRKISDKRRYDPTLFFSFFLSEKLAEHAEKSIKTGMNRIVDMSDESGTKRPRRE